MGPDAPPAKAENIQQTFANSLDDLDAGAVRNSVVNGGAAFLGTAHKANICFMAKGRVPMRLYVSKEAGEVTYRLRETIDEEMMRQIKLLPTAGTIFSTKFQAFVDPPEKKEVAPPQPTVLPPWLIAGVRFASFNTIWAEEEGKNNGKQGG